MSSSFHSDYAHFLAFIRNKLIGSFSMITPKSQAVTTYLWDKPEFSK